jgi:DNA (cytosine-5)-methyltransferase 1
MSLGFEKAGFKIVGAFDNWTNAVEVYKKNLTHPVSLHDLSDIKKTVKIVKKLRPQIIIGGPPCQDFSSAGKRDVTLGRADLTIKFTATVLGVRPPWFVMENVEQIKKSHILKKIIANFIGAGYGLTAVILDASLCGVPQIRTRFFLVGSLGCKHNQIKNTFRQMLSEKRMTVKDYLKDSINISFYYRHPRNYNRRAFYSVDEPSATIRGVNRPVPPNYKLSKCDPPDIDIRKVRPLTTIERSYIQTFPKGFKFTGAKTDMEQMIGNAVPVNLSKFVADAIISFIKNGPQKNGMLFTEDQINPKFELPSKVLSRH